MSWLYQVLVKKYPFTQYLGEEQIECKTQVQSIIYRGQELENLATTDDATLSEVILIFNQTVFYAESGGQIGDVGEILDETDNLMGLVTTTKKQEQLFLHHCQIFTSIKVGQKVKLKIINEKRNDIRKNHSATHLLHRVLGDILGNHIQQAGSLVTAEKLRFDFNHFEAMKQEQIEQVEDQVNDFIFSNLPVTISEMSIDEAKKKGAKAFFEEKYGEVVRVIDIGGESIELCGGSHVKKTGEIGLFKIVQEGSSASGIRRIEAITGRAAQADFRMMKQVTRELQKTTSLANVKKIPEKVLQIQAEVKKLQKELFTFQSKELREKLNSMSSEEITGKTKKIQFFNAILTEADIKSLREIINQRIQQTDKSIIFVGVRQEKKCVLLCAVHKNLTAKIKAGDIIHQAAHICGGGGGGRSDFAQAGGKHPQKIPIAIKKVKEMILNI